MAAAVCSLRCSRVFASRLDVLDRDPRRVVESPSPDGRLHVELFREAWVIVAHVLLRAPVAGAQRARHGRFVVLSGEDARHEKKPRVASVADGHCGHGDAREASARSTATSRDHRAVASGTGTPITGSVSHRRRHSGQVRGAAGTGDDHLRAPRSAAVCTYSYITSGVRCTLTTTHLVRHAELGQHVDRALHDTGGRCRSP